MSSVRERQCFSNKTSCSQNSNVANTNNDLWFGEKEFSIANDHSSTSRCTIQRQSYYSAISSSFGDGSEQYSIGNFTSSLSTPSHCSKDFSSESKVEEYSVKGRKKTVNKDIYEGKRMSKNYTLKELREPRNCKTELSMVKPLTDTPLSSISSQQQRHFNVVFLWEDLEYKLLNVYHVEYFKYFECLVEHALYQASICIANKHRLEEVKNDLLAIDGGESQRTGNFNNNCKRAFRKSMRQLQLEVIDISKLEEFKYWRHIEIRMARELYHREEVFWKTMDLVNQMQALRTYYLL